MMSLHTAKLCDIETRLNSLPYYYHPRPLISRQRLSFYMGGIYRCTPSDDFQIVVPSFTTYLRCCKKWPFLAVQELVLAEDDGYT